MPGRFLNETQLANADEATSIGVVFVFQAKLIRLWTWQDPTQTAFALILYSLVCLNPHLLALVPFAGLLFAILIPAFLARHPPPPSSASSLATTLSPTGIAGPALAPPRVIRPADAPSRDFFRNMRDLQNAMADFADAHDLLLAALTPWTNFAHEARSTALAVLLCGAALAAYVLAALLPWRVLGLAGGWALVALGHAGVQRWAQRTYRVYWKPWARDWVARFDAWAAADVALDAPPEICTVEVFELQRRKSGADAGSAWEAWVFGPAAWEPRAPARVAGERPPGTRFLEDVRAPPGWRWAGPRWELDRAGREWVEARMLSGVEAEAEAGGAWAFDVEEVGKGEKAGKGKGKRWGEWRRRRWVRDVRRAIVRSGGHAGSARVGNGDTGAKTSAEK